MVRLTPLILVLLIGCRPAASERLRPHLGKTGRVLVVAGIDPADTTHQWFEDVRLIRLTDRDGEACAVLRFMGLEVSPSNDGQPMEVPIPIARIVEVHVAGRAVYLRDP